MCEVGSGINDPARLWLHAGRYGHKNLAVTRERLAVTQTFPGRIRHVYWVYCMQRQVPIIAFEVKLIVIYTYSPVSGREGDVNHLV